MKNFNFKNHKFFKKNGKKAYIRSRQQYLIWCVISDPENCSWPKETKMATKLLKEFPDLGFWLQVPGYFQFKPDSLAYCFSSGFGYTILKESYSIFQRLKNVKLETKDSEDLSSSVIGKNVKVIKKPKNILEFIRNKNG